MRRMRKERFRLSSDGAGRPEPSLLRLWITMSAHLNNHHDVTYQEAAASEVQRVPIRSLQSADSPRINGEDSQHINMLVQADTPLPPILVQRGTMRVIDGMHRLRAAMLLGDETIEVRFFDGTDADAFIAGVKANTEHGLPLTLADREAAASRIIALYPEYSDRWIADISGLAPGTVSIVRRRLTDRDVLAKKRRGRDGRMRPLDGTDGRRMAIRKIAEHPDASLREIARMVGVSPGTVRDVRNRMARGEDPVLRKQPDSGARERLPDDGDGQEKRKARASVSRARDRGKLLLKLQRDPSLRFSETGRKLLRQLEILVYGPDELVGLVETIPPHCVYLIAELARCCADDWLQATHSLQKWLDDAQ